eukprot:1610958-Pyramimonas_sp.AAC.1
MGHGRKWSPTQQRINTSLRSVMKAARHLARVCFAPLPITRVRRIATQRNHLERERAVVALVTDKVAQQGVALLQVRALLGVP